MKMGWLEPGGCECWVGAHTHTHTHTHTVAKIRQTETHADRQTGEN